MEMQVKSIPNEAKLELPNRDIDDVLKIDDIILENWNLINTDEQFLKKYPYLLKYIKK